MKSKGENKARGIRNSSPNINVNKKNGNVPNQIINGMAKIARKKVISSAKPTIISKRAIGTEKNPTNQEYHGMIPKNVNVPPTINAINSHVDIWLNAILKVVAFTIKFESMRLFNIPSLNELKSSF